MTSVVYYAQCRRPDLDSCRVAAALALFPWHRADNGPERLPGRVGPDLALRWLTLVRPVYYSTVYRVDGVSIAVAVIRRRRDVG
jgi:hypothetical protein